MKYLLHKYSRLKSWEVNIGGVSLGGDNPIRLQSMTNTSTHDFQATLEQSIRIIDAGGEYVRITAPCTRDVDSLLAIQEELKKKGYKTPLIADIHFSPNVASYAAKKVDKIRINPGNFNDRKYFKTIDYTDEEYKTEIKRIEERFTPLLLICKENQTAMRIGVNHGSLSDRILSRYGDTPAGMAESAMEFLRICKKNEFYKVVVSMKASNTRIMVQATRKLVDLMQEEEMFYPLHLGVTEAGEGEDGRIKSAIGIGTLLAKGIGDTVRVSLTEAPEKEIPVAKKIVDYVISRAQEKNEVKLFKIELTPYEFNRRKSEVINEIGGTNVPVVIGENSESAFDEFKPDYIFTEKIIPFDPGTKFILPFKLWTTIDKSPNVFPLLNQKEFLESRQNSEQLFVLINSEEDRTEILEKLKTNKKATLVFESRRINSLAEYRHFLADLQHHKMTNPIILFKQYNESYLEDLQIKSAIDFGPHCIDGLIDGIWIKNTGKIETNESNKTAFSILQASRLRMSKPDYISCPGCGRTLFGLEDTVAKIKKETSHLKGLKIGIMGCIVNGPGEMADADYGYVGTGAGKISLYKNKEVVKRNIEESKAVDELVALIKENGDWKEIE